MSRMPFEDLPPGQRWVLWLGTVGVVNIPVIMDWSQPGGIKGQTLMHSLWCALALGMVYLLMWLSPHMESSPPTARQVPSFLVWLTVLGMVALMTRLLHEAWRVSP